jgi:site-specific DNA-cytosine methylase
MSGLDLNTEIRVGHLCCGSGFGARGFRKANARVGTLKATFRNIGGIDVDAAGIRDFERFAGVKGTVLDLMDRDQYRAFHAAEPPEGWREAMPADIHRAMGGERPHIWFVSAPCKGFSGLLSEAASKALRYQALNRLTLRAVWLALEAYKDDPVEFILFENVPRIANRGRPLLDKIQALLEAYGYAYAETTHDCGELGGLAQSRKRFLLVGRHREKVPPFLYEPPKRRLRGVGEVLDKLPVPGGDPVHPMHRLPRLQWKTWVRLAFVEAGSDWRSLNKLAIKNGHLADYLIVPDMRRGVLGVNRWDETAGTVTGVNRPTNGAYSVADSRAPAGAAEYGQYGVRPWGETSGAVINVKSPGQGAFSVADPRASGSFEGAGKYRVTAFGEAVGTVIAGSTTGQGAFAVADPRPRAFAAGRGSYQTQGHYGVTMWDEPTGAVPGFAKHDRGRWSVADPRPGPQGANCPRCGAVCREDAVSICCDACARCWPKTTEWGDRLPAPDERLTCRIEALDGTWHRPFTTLELAALQSLFDPEEWSEFAMDGASDSAWRERIGNAVPSDAAAAIAGVMGRTLLLAWSGETFLLSNDPIWVQPITVALSVDVPVVREVSV